MVDFTFEEYADKYLIYSKVRCNTKEAERLYFARTTDILLLKHLRSIVANGKWAVWNHQQLPDNHDVKFAFEK